MRRGTAKPGRRPRRRWPDDLHDWTVVDRTPDEKARNAAFAVFSRLENLSAMALGAEVDALGDTGVPFFRFDGPAQERFYRWRTRWEKYCPHGDHHPAMESHLTKYRKLVPALALVIHLVDGREGPVRDHALEQAIGWAEVLESHARRIYARGIGPAIAHARALALRIIRGDVEDGFTLRDVYSNHWSLLGTRDEARMAAAELVELDWLRPETQPTGGRPRHVHWINPAAYTMPV
jgi:putative DNA primase/helicase